MYLLSRSSGLPTILSTAFSFIFVLLCGATPLVSMAQFEKMGASGPSIQLTPAYPAPGQKVTATLTSVRQLGTHYVTWTLDGVVVQQSAGGVTYTFTAGPAGTRLNLSAVATDESSATISAQKSVSINDAFIVWEAQTYTPPLFRGRGLMSPGSTVTAMVIPNIYDNTGTLYDPKKLVYTWRVDAGAKPHAVGTGLTSVSIKNERLFKTLRVSVNIQTAGGTVVATVFTEIPPVQPEVLLYEDNKLLGTQYAHSLRGEYQLSASEVTVLSEPYYMSTSARDAENLQYVWQIGSVTETNPGSIILRPEGAGSGRATLGVTITNREYLTQRIRGELSILFSSNTTREQSNSKTTAL